MKISIRVWILIIALLLALLAIKPTFEKGVLIRSIDTNSAEFNIGIKSGDIIKEINGVKINNLEDYQKFVSSLTFEKKNFSVQTDNQTFNYTAYEFGFYYENGSILVYGKEAIDSGLKDNMTLVSINQITIKNKEDFESAKRSLESEKKITIKTKSNKAGYVFYTKSPLSFTISDVPKSNIRTGLDLRGGARALVKPERKISKSELQDLLDTTRNRLNVFGLTDINIRSVTDLSGNDYMLIEVAGATTKDLQDLVAKQGKFEAKIGNKTVFIGGEEDITSVCKGDASCSGIEACYDTSQGALCRFRFVVYLTEEAAKRHADITSTLGVNITDGGRYLSEKLDLYVDDKLVDSLLISEDLKGKITTQIQVQGSGVGRDRKEAIANAQENMLKLQTILVTGSLPFKLQIEKLDSVSPLLGEEFMKQVLIIGLIAFLSVFFIIFLKFRKIKLSLLVITTMFSELFITLGFAALIKWNLDLASIAGIIAGIGTGVDDQIVIMDESNLNKVLGWKQRIKKAFFIILSAYFTVFVSLLPLFWAGAGMLRGFAFTTFIGITAGVLITRPAFADIVSQISE